MVANIQIGCKGVKRALKTNHDGAKNIMNGDQGVTRGCSACMCLLVTDRLLPETQVLEVLWRYGVKRPVEQGFPSFFCQFFGIKVVFDLKVEVRRRY